MTTGITIIIIYFAKTAQKAQNIMKANTRNTKMKRNTKTTIIQLTEDEPKYKTKATKQQNVARSNTAHRRLALPNSTVATAPLSTGLLHPNHHASKSLDLLLTWY